MVVYCISVCEWLKIILLKIHYISLLGYNHRFGFLTCLCNFQINETK